MFLVGAGGRRDGGKEEGRREGGRDNPSHYLIDRLNYLPDGEGGVVVVVWLCCGGALARGGQGPIPFRGRLASCLTSSLPLSLYYTFFSPSLKLFSFIFKIHFSFCFCFYFCFLFGTKLENRFVFCYFSFIQSLSWILLFTKLK